MTKELEYVDHLANLPSKVLTQYKTSPKFFALLEPFVENLNDFESEFEKFRTTLTIESATGLNLDKIGDILNAKTRPADDETYRKNLYALVFAYNSEGTALDIVRLFQTVVTAEVIQLREIYDAKFQVHLKEPAASTDYQFLYRAMRLAKPSGVGYLPISTSPLTPTFSFDSDSDPDVLGFSVIGGADGGYYSILQPEI